MNVVDSSAWLSYFAGDENSFIFLQPIEKIDDLLVPSISLREVFKCFLRQRGEGLAIEVIARMEQVYLDSSLAVDAAHYGVELNLPLADSIVYSYYAKV